MLAWGRPVAGLAGVILIVHLAACNDASPPRQVDVPSRSQGQAVTTQDAPPTNQRSPSNPEAHSMTVQKTDEQWRAQLTAEQYRITRQKGTERAFSGQYWNTKTAGTYQCVGCGQALYKSDAKFDSGTGWPSFWQPVDDAAVTTESDHTLGMVRTEVLCSRCGAHLGHVFDDGPRPTGMRHCINSAALHLVESQPPAPDSD